MLALLCWVSDPECCIVFSTISSLDHGYGLLSAEELGCYKCFVTSARLLLNFETVTFSVFKNILPFVHLLHTHHSTSVVTSLIV